MSIDEFIEDFAEQFDNTDKMQFNEFTRFKESEEWSSLTALFVICMANEEYNVTLRSDDIQKANTIGDLYQILLSKM